MVRLLHEKSETNESGVNFNKIRTLFNWEYWLDSVYSLLVFTAFSRYYNYQSFCSCCLFVFSIILSTCINFRPQSTKIHFCNIFSLQLHFTDHRFVYFINELWFLLVILGIKIVLKIWKPSYTSFISVLFVRISLSVNNHLVLPPDVLFKKL